MESFTRNRSANTTISTAAVASRVPYSAFVADAASVGKDANHKQSSTFGYLNKRC